MPATIIAHDLPSHRSPILVALAGFCLLLSAHRPALAACQRAGASAPFIGAADMREIDRAVVSLPAVGTKQVVLDVGATLPRGFETRAVPSAVRRVLPQYAGYRAFRSGMTLVIVDPGSRRMAYLLPLRRHSAPTNCPE